MMKSPGIAIREWISLTEFFGRIIHTLVSVNPSAGSALPERTLFKLLSNRNRLVAAGGTPRER